MAACALCGTPAPPPYRAPAPEGSPDLDGRPGEPTRSTLPRWLQTCTGCGACAPDLATLPASAAVVVSSQAYTQLPAPSERWVALVTGTAAEAEAWLHAAWRAEDDGEDGSALRGRAVAAWPTPVDAEGLVRLADTQRRAGLLQEATATLDAILLGHDAGTAQVIAFERARIALGDTGRHLLSSALRPPARTPHVSHGRRKPAGFWARLLGGSAR